MSAWYTIQARGQKSAEVFIYGDIGRSWNEESVTAKQFVDEINALDVAAITVRINSVGGSVPDGLAIYNALKRHKATVTTSVDALAASIASLIAMAGDTVEIAENALLMIHAPWTVAMGNSAALRETADVLDRFAKAMAGAYQRGGQASTEAILALLTDGTDHWYSAEEAVAAGFCRPHGQRHSHGRLPGRQLQRPFHAARAAGCDSPRQPPLNPLRKEMS